MKKTLAAAAVVLATSALLAGCSSSTSPKSSGKVTITYSDYIASGGNEKNLATIVSAFEKANPDIKVDVTTTDYADYFTKLQTDLSAGTQADVFDLDNSDYPIYQAEGVLAPLHDFDASKYRASLLDAFKTGGTQYALPTDFSDVVLFYNESLFKKAGIPLPTDNWTWADETAAAKKLTDASAGVFGDYQPITYNEFYKAIEQAGGSFLTSNGKKADFDSAAGIKAAEWLAGKSGTTMPTVAQGADTPNDDVTLFKEGKLAMDHTGIWEFDVFGKLPFQWNVVVDPGDAKQASATFSDSVAISADSKHKAAAQKFAEYLSSSREMIDIRLKSGWELPPTSDESLLKSYLDATPPQNRQAVFTALEHTAPAPVLGPNSQQIQTLVTNALSNIAAGRQKAAPALAQAAQQVDALLKK